MRNGQNRSSKSRKQKIMNSDHKRFFVFLSCVVVLTIVLTFLFKQIIPLYVTPFWALQILFFAIVNIIVYFITVKVKSKNDIKKLAQFNMVMTVTKLMVYLAIIAIYSFIFPEDSKPFTISFLAYYLCFSFFETFVKVKIKN